MAAHKRCGPPCTPAPFPPLSVPASPCPALRVGGGCAPAAQAARACVYQCGCGRGRGRGGGRGGGSGLPQWHHADLIRRGARPGVGVAVVDNLVALAVYVVPLALCTPVHVPATTIHVVPPRGTPPHRREHRSSQAEDGCEQEHLAVLLMVRAPVPALSYSCVRESSTGWCRSACSARRTNFPKA